MGWRNRFDPGRFRVDRWRERAKRLRDIRALGGQVAQVRRVGLRGEFIVPAIALIILATALALSALAPDTPDQASSTPTVVGDAGQLLDDTPSPAETIVGSGEYPSITNVPAFDVSPTPFGTDPTFPFTPTATLTDTIAGGTNPFPTAYPGQNTGPQPIDPPVSTFPTLPPLDSGNNGQGTQPPQTVPQFPTPALIPTPVLAPTVPVFPTSPRSGGGYPPPSVPTTDNSNSFPTPVVAPTTPPFPPATTPVPGATNTVPTPAGQPTVAQPTIPQEPPTSAATSTPVLTPVPPTPTPRPAEIISGNVHWTLANSPKILTKDQVVAAGSSLTIDPGVEVRLGPNVQLTVAGTLRAQGTAAAQVRLVGSGGRWDSLVGTRGSTIVLDNTQIRQAGRNGTALSSSGGALVVRNSSLSDSGGGIVALGSSLELQSTQITGNSIGGPVVNVQVPARGATNIKGNIIGGNGTPAGAPQILLTADDAAGPIAIEGNLLVGGAGAALIVNTDTPLQGTIRCNSFTGGTVGLQLSARRPDTAGFDLAIDNNAFSGQQNYGATGTLAFNLANNWWNDPSGPRDAQRNPQGRGVPVGVNLQFQPWLTGRPACAPNQ